MTTQAEREKLDKQIISKNLNISDLYKRWNQGLLQLSPDFQRKLVWKQEHKVRLIETVLENFPFPEVYVANGDSIEIDNIPHKVQLIIDGQQRLSTIFNYIKGEDIFSLPKLKIPHFQSLSTDEKEQFMDYMVSVRDLRSIPRETMIKIFDRINQSSYTLNKMEKDNAQFLDSEFLLFCKQLIEEDISFLNFELIKFKVPDQDREIISHFFHNECSIFSDVDHDRMISLQYAMTLIATLILGSYFGRNSGADKCLRNFNEEFPESKQVLKKLKDIIGFIKEVINLKEENIWNTKSNIFTLFVELYNLDINQINIDNASKKIDEIANAHKEFLAGNKQHSAEYIEFFENSREGVNQQNRRKSRGEFVKEIFLNS